jgi:hypothetical protein
VAVGVAEGGIEEVLVVGERRGGEVEVARGTGEVLGHGAASEVDDLVDCGDFFVEEASGLVPDVASGASRRRGLRPLPDVGYRPAPRHLLVHRPAEPVDVLARAGGEGRWPQPRRHASAPPLASVARAMLRGWGVQKTTMDQRTLYRVAAALCAAAAGALLVTVATGEASVWRPALAGLGVIFGIAAVLVYGKVARLTR